MVYDPIARKLYCFYIDTYSYGSYRIYDPLADTLSTKRSLTGRGHLTIAQIPILKGRTIYFVSGSPPFTLDVDSGKLVDLLGGFRPDLYKQTGDYASTQGKIYAMNSPKGAWGSFSVLDAQTGTWSQFEPVGSPPSPPASLPAPYTKFRIYERKNGAFMVLFHLANTNLHMVRIA